MEDPGDQRGGHPPLVRAGLAALLVPAVLGLTAVPGLVVEEPSWPLLVLTVVGFTFVFLAGEDGLAIGVLAAAAMWAPVVAAIWWTVGRRTAAGTARDPAGFSWAAWARRLARVAPLVLVAQTIGALVASAAIGPLLLAVALVLLLRRYLPGRSVPQHEFPEVDAYEQHKQCPQCGEFIAPRSSRCRWCDETLEPQWHESMP